MGQFEEADQLHKAIRENQREYAEWLGGAVSLDPLAREDHRAPSRVKPFSEERGGETFFKVPPTLVPPTFLMYTPRTKWALIHADATIFPYLPMRQI